MRRKRARKSRIPRRKTTAGALCHARSARPRMRTAAEVRARADEPSRVRKLPARRYRSGRSYLLGVAIVDEGFNSAKWFTFCLSFPSQKRGAAGMGKIALDLPFTICLCLLSQLLGWSLRCSTTWLLCSRLVRSYHAVEIMAFSRWRFLIICSCAACGGRITLSVDPEKSKIVRASLARENKTC